MKERAQTNVESTNKLTIKREKVATGGAPGEK